MHNGRQHRHKRLRNDGRWPIGLARRDRAAGLWHEQPDAFALRREIGSATFRRRGGPDLPVESSAGTDENTGRGRDWSVGRVTFSLELYRVLARSDRPLISTPNVVDGSRAIACSAWQVDNEGTLWLYNARNDRERRRATIR